MEMQIKRMRQGRIERLERSANAADWLAVAWSQMDGAAWWAMPIADRLEVLAELAELEAEQEVGSCRFSGRVWRDSSWKAVAA
jgi:hypothetical protein